MRARKQRGFTLVEYVLVVGLMIAVAILVFVYSSGAKVSARVNQEMATIGTAAGRIRNLFASHGGYAGISTAVLIGAKAFPSTSITGTVVNNTFGGTITVAPATLGGAPNAGYSWTMTAVPQAECIDLLTAVDNLFVEMRVNGVEVKPYLGSLDKTLLSDGSACAAGDMNDVVLVAM
jgi:type II secretory pathway pseudopilin PulG